MKPTPPTIEGPYTPLRLLGEGGMGAVWEVEHETTGQRYALKTMRGFDTEDLARFQREARTLAGLNHPHVVRLHTAELQGQQPYLVQELLSGGSLADALRKGPLDVERAREVAKHLAAGVRAAHEAGVLHRDLKPDNVLFSEDGVPKLTDFGLAVGSNESRERLTLTGAVLGTPAYMAPEQAMDARRVDERADVYALGALLYAMLTGVPPLPTEGVSLIAALTALQTKAPRPPEELNPAVTADLSEVCRVALAKAPSERYPSAAAFAQALGIGSAVRPRSRAPWALGAVAIGCALLAAGAIAWVASRPTPTDPTPPVILPTPVEPAVDPPAPASPALPNPFVLPSRVSDGMRPVTGAFLADGLVTLTAGQVRVWRGLELTAELEAPLPAPPENVSRTVSDLLPLGPQRYLIGGDGLTLCEWTPEGLRSHGLEGLRTLARHGSRVAYGLASGEVGVLRLRGDGRLEPEGPVVDLSDGEARQAQDLAWLSPTRLAALARGRTFAGQTRDPVIEVDRENKGRLQLLSYDPESGELAVLETLHLPSGYCLTASGGDPQIVAVGTSAGNLFLWRVELGNSREKLVKAGSNYRELGTPTTCRDVVFVSDTVCLGALDVRQEKVTPANRKRFERLNGVLVYDLAAEHARVFRLTGIGPRRLVYDAASRQVVVLGERGSARVLPLDTILEFAEELGE